MIEITEASLQRIPKLFLEADLIASCNTTHYCLYETKPNPQSWNQSTNLENFQGRQAVQASRSQIEGEKNPIYKVTSFIDCELSVFA